MPSAVENVTYIDGLGINTDSSNTLDGFFYRRAFLEVNILHGHDASGAVLGIAQKLVYLTPGVGTCLSQNPGYDVSGHFFHQVGCVIGHQVINDPRSFLIGHDTYDLLLEINIKV